MKKREISGLMYVRLIIFLIGVVCLLPVNEIYAEDLRPHAGLDVTVISEGETKFIDVETGGVLLLGDLHILNVVILGSGELGIAMEKSDTGGELIMMTGVAISSGGATTPFFKAGFTPNVLSQSVEIGDETNPNGFLFMITGVLFSLGKVEEGSYSIELGF